MKNILYLTTLLIFVLTLSCSHQTDETGPIKIAVLPFNNTMPGKTDYCYGTGMAYEVIDRLYYFDDLTIRPLNMVSGRSITGYTAKEFRDNLDVDYIFNGSYKKDGEIFKLNIEISGVNGFSTFYEHQFEIPYTEITSLANNAAIELARAIDIIVTEKQKGNIKRNAPAKIESYEYYLKSLDLRYGSNRDVLESIRMSEKSTSLDPEFAPAFSLLGDAYLSYSGLVGGAEGFYEQGGEAYRKSMELNPDNPITYHKLGMFNTKTGQPEDAVALLKDGKDMNPNIPGFYTGLGYVYRYAGLMDESIEMYRHSMILDASLRNAISSGMQILKSEIYMASYEGAYETFDNVLSAHQQLGSEVSEKDWFYGAMVSFYAGDTTNAFLWYDKAVETDPNSVWSQFGQAYKAILEGDTGLLNELIVVFEERNDVDGERQYRLVPFYSQSGRKEDAVKKLSSTISAGFFNYPYFRDDYLIDTIRGEDGFDELLGIARDRHLVFTNM